MNTTNPALESCLAFIHGQVAGLSPESGPKLEVAQPAITISRQSGTGGFCVGEKTAHLLDRQMPGPCAWTVFDRNLVEQVLTEHQLPQDLAEYLPEDRRSELSDIVEELLGLHPPSWTLLRQVSETILHLADTGRVIIVGRGSHIITRSLENTFHVRLVGSLEKRCGRIQEVLNLSAGKAREFVHKQDAARRLYLKRNFNAEIDDATLYHLVINMDCHTCAQAAEVIADAVAHRFRSTLPPHSLLSPVASSRARHD